MTVAEIVPATMPETSEEEVSAELSDGGLVEEELLVEEISIDGMCGVY
jgi:mycofactocin precursor